MISLSAALQDPGACAVLSPHSALQGTWLALDDGNPCHTAARAPPALDTRVSLCPSGDSALLSSLGCTCTAVVAPVVWRHCWKREGQGWGWAGFPGPVNLLGAAGRTPAHSAA